jgi:hypothetical protein
LRIADQMRTASSGSRRRVIDADRLDHAIPIGDDRGRLGRFTRAGRPVHEGSNVGTQLDGPQGRLARNGPSCEIREPQARPARLDW